MPLKDNAPLRLSFDNFIKGHISRLTPERTPIDAFSDSQNISLNERFLPIQAFGQYKYNSTTLGAYPVRGGITYVTTAGTKYYVVACAGFLWYSVVGSGTFAKYQVTLNSSAVDMTVNEDTDFEFAQYNGRLYVVNGKYPIITNDHSSDHSFTTSRMIKITTTTVVGLTVADIPSGLQYIWIDKERLFGANSIAQGSGLFWTNAYFDYFTNAETNWTPVSGLNYDYVGKDDGESISALFPYQNSMFVFKSRNVYRYSTAGDITNWGSVRVDTNYGAPFNRTVWELEGYLYWLSFNGIVQFDGTNTTLMDDNINPDILSLPQLSSNSRQWNIGQTLDFNAGVTAPDAILKSGTATGGSATTLIDTVNLTEADDYWNGKYVQIVAGTNLGKIAAITDFDHATAKITFGTMTTACDTTTRYRIYTSATPILGGIIDTADNQIQQHSRVADFVNGSFGTKVLSVGTNIKLLAQKLAADWNLGTFVNTVVSGNTIILNTVLTAINNLALNKPTTVSANSPGSSAVDGNNNTAWQSPRVGLGQPSTDNWIYVDLGTQQVTKRYQLRLQSVKVDPGTYGNLVVHPFAIQLSNDANTWTTLATLTPPNTGTNGWDWYNTFNYRYVRIFQAGIAYGGWLDVYEIRLFNDFPSAGSFTTQTFDFGFTPTSMGILTATTAQPNGTSLAFSTRTSADGTNWDAYVAVNSGAAITSTAKRYIQIKVDFFGTAGLYTPVLQSIAISAPFMSEILDYGITPASFGNFAPSVLTPSDSTITYATRSSADGTTWEAWVAVVAAAAITSTANRYFQWYALISPSTDGVYAAQINDVFIGGQWRSAIENFGATPTAWGSLDTTYVLNSQTVTWWMRSAATSGGIAAATWYQQTSGFPVTATVTLAQYAQVEIRLNTTLATQIPIMESFRVIWYTGAKLLKPCAYILNKEYCLNVADVGQSVNNLLWRYNPSLGYFLPRTNKYNNVYFIDEGVLISGTSSSDGYTRLNEIGHTDDGVAIDCWFITKNVEQGSFYNLFKMYFVNYKADQSWTLSYSTDNGNTWTDLTIPASGVTQNLRKTLTGLVYAHFMMMKCRQALSDANWQVGQMGMEFEPGYEKSDD